MLMSSFELFMQQNSAGKQKSSLALSLFYYSKFHKEQGNLLINNEDTCCRPKGP